MTTLYASIGAVLLGALTAWWIYYYKSSASNRGLLALFRFSWIALLVFALLSPDGIGAEEKTLLEPVTVLQDTSASVEGNALGLTEEIIQDLDALQIEAELRDYDLNRVPSIGKWIYVGDGHLESSWMEVKPDLIALVAGREPQRAPLITGISLPSRVRAGSSVQVEILGDPEASYSTEVNGLKTVGKSFRFRAPTVAGPLRLRTVARLKGQLDSLEVSVEVVESLTNVTIVYGGAHPHVGLSKRILERQGVSVDLVAWSDIQSLRDFDGPIICVGGGLKVLTKLQQFSKNPILWLDDAQPRQRTVPVNLTLNYGGRKREISVFAKDKNTQVKESDLLIDARGIHWYSSALARESVFEVFNLMVGHLLELHSSNTLRLTIPNRAFREQSIEGVLVLTNGLNEPVQANFELALRKENEVILIPTVQYEGSSGKFRFSLDEPGSFELVAMARSQGKEYKTSALIQVDNVQPELMLPFNESLMEHWERAGATLVETDSWEWEIASDLASGLERGISIKKRKPQHSSALYWGLVMVLALVEWSLRRRTGLT